MADDQANEAAETKLMGTVAVEHASEIVNYFVGSVTAIRYASKRPSSHARVLELLQSTLPNLPVERALDVGCGTGHSTQALLAYAETIVGVDSSSEMLAQAVVHPRISYRKGYA